MKRNSFNRYFRVLAPDEGEGSQNGGGTPPPEGLSARLAAFAQKEAPENNPKSFGDQTKAEPIEIQEKTEPQKEKAPEKVDPKPKEEVKDEEVEDSEEDFPEIGKTAETKPDEEVEEGFDEAKFDEATKAILKGLEEKGHPGEMYKGLRQELKDAQKALAEAKASSPEIETLKQTIATLQTKADEADGLRQRNEELIKSHEKLAVQESEPFINEVIKPMQEIELTVNELAKATGIDPEEIFAAIEEPNLVKQDAMLEALGPKLKSSRNLSRVERFADDYKGIAAKRDKMLAEGKTIMDRAREQERIRIEQEGSQKKQAFQSAATASFDRYASRVPGFTDSSGVLTGTAKSVRAKALSVDVSQLSPDDLGYMTFAAQSFPELRKAYVKLEKEAEQLRIAAGKPSGVGGKAPAPKKESTTDLNEDGSPKGLIDVMKGQVFTFSGQ